MDDFMDFLGPLVLVLAGVTIFALGMVSWIATKKVDGYYFSSGDSSGLVTCVYAHWTWHSDEKAFCSADYREALEFAAKANIMIR